MHKMTNKLQLTSSLCIILFTLLRKKRERETPPNMQEPQHPLATDKHKPPRILDFSYDVLSLIIECLDQKSFLALASTCRQFYELCFNESVVGKQVQHTFSTSVMRAVVATQFPTLKQQVTHLEMRLYSAGINHGYVNTGQDLFVCFVVGKKKKEES